MRLVRYQTQDRRPRHGLLENGQIYDLEATSEGQAAGGDMRAFLAQGQAVIDEVASAARAGHAAREDSVSLLAPFANPGKLFRLSAARADRGTYESDVRDAQTVARWGSLKWHASVPQAAGEQGPRQA